MNKEILNRLMKNIEKSQGILTALGNEKRQEILIIMLKQGCNNAITVSELTKYIDMSRPALSHQLKILLDLNILLMEKKGTYSYYQFNPQITEIDNLKMVLEDIQLLINNNEEGLENE